MGRLGRCPRCNAQARRRCRRQILLQLELRMVIERAVSLLRLQEANVAKCDVPLSRSRVLSLSIRTCAPDFS